MREQDILAATYHDAADVYRRGNPAKDPETKQIRQTEALVASGVPGAWSKTSGDPYNQSGRVGLARVDGVYFCAPDAAIQLGDKVIVRTAVGEALTLIAGKPMRYVSHAEIPMGADERA